MREIDEFDELVTKSKKLGGIELLSGVKQAEDDLSFVELSGNYEKYDEICLRVKALNCVLSTRIELN